MRQTPLQDLHDKAEASSAYYGPVDAGVRLVETFGELELEYAALRKSCVLIDRPDRGVLCISGADRLDFLNRMVTQELKNLGESGEEGARIARTFWLNRKGRIDADMTLIAQGDAILVDVDIHALERAAKGLGAFIISEEVAIDDATGRLHRFSLHGPSTLALLASVAEAPASAIASLARDRSMSLRIAGSEVIAFRDDSTGEIGIELIVPVESAIAFYTRLRDAGSEPLAEGEPRLGEAGGGIAAHERAKDARPRVRLSGWHAYNIARIEAGRALYNLDFGVDSLPHETGDETLADRVNFKKGCYLGQEVVARMHSRGHPKQKLVAIRCESRVGLLGGEAQLPQAILPVTGASVFPANGAEGTPAIGAVTSSTLSPMLSQRPICFAMMKWDNASPGTNVEMEAEGERIAGTVQESLRFWKKDATERESRPIEST